MDQLGDLEEAEATYARAVEQIEKWGQHDTPFAKEQVQEWKRIQRLNSWCLPGGSSR